MHFYIFIVYEHCLVVLEALQRGLEDCHRQQRHPQMAEVVLVAVVAVVLGAWDHRVLVTTKVHSAAAPTKTRVCALYGEGSHQDAAAIRH